MLNSQPAAINFTATDGCQGALYVLPWQLYHILSAHYKYSIMLRAISK